VLDRNIKKMVWMIYAIPAMPLFIYVAANLASGIWRIVICSVMFAVFTGLVWLTKYSENRSLQSNLTGGTADTVEISDPAAEDFLRAMNATAAGQSQK
jgi:hypothetical protein